MPTASSITDPVCERLPEERHSRFARIFEATTDVVAMTDQAGRLLYLNAAGRRLLDLSEDAPITAHTLRHMHPEWAYEIVVQEGLPTAQSDGSWSFALQIKEGFPNHIALIVSDTGWIQHGHCIRYGLLRRRNAKGFDGIKDQLIRRIDWLVLHWPLESWFRLSGLCGLPIEQDGAAQPDARGPDFETLGNQFSVVNRTFHRRQADGFRKDPGLHHLIPTAA